MSVHFTGKIEFTMSKEKRTELEEKMFGWFPDKQIALTEQEMVLNDAFETGEKLTLLLLFIEKNGEIIDADIHRQFDQHITAINGSFYVCERDKYRLLASEMDQKMEKELSDELLVALFDLCFSSEKLVVS